MNQQKMHIGMSIRGLGYHPAAWRHPDVPADGTLRFERYARSAQAAERGKCDMIFFADGIGIRERDAPRGSLSRSGYEIIEMEPMTLLPALAVRQLYQQVAGMGGFCPIGTPAQIADMMQEWFENDACDGFNITPTHLPAGCEDFVDMVIPELQRRGLFRTEYEGTTLRGNLGLKPVVNRYLKDPAQRAAE
jgi:alkanesulfonate monooxygenase SsuD/methylene tetrahydromethanopterin reductase-like flavin-dependent oxidoreductase (luciferase family)